MQKLNLIVLSLTCALVLSGCASGSAVHPPQMTCPQLAPAPAAVMQERRADFSERMRNFLFERPSEPTK